MVEADRSQTLKYSAHMLPAGILGLDTSSEYVTVISSHGNNG